MSKAEQTKDSAKSPELGVKSTRGFIAGMVASSIIDWVMMATQDPKGVYRSFGLVNLALAGIIYWINRDAFKAAAAQITKKNGTKLESDQPECRNEAKIDPTRPENKTSNKETNDKSI